MCCFVPPPLGVLLVMSLCLHITAISLSLYIVCSLLLPSLTMFFLSYFLSLDPATHLHSSYPFPSYLCSASIIVPLTFLSPPLFAFTIPYRSLILLLFPCLPFLSFILLHTHLHPSLPFPVVPCLVNRPLDWKGECGSSRPFPVLLSHK